MTERPAPLQPGHAARELVRTVTRGAMVRPLERQERVNRLDGLRIERTDADLASERKRIELVGDRISLRAHDVRSRDVRGVVHEPGDSEVPVRKHPGDVAEMGPDLLYAGGVRVLPLELDTAAVGHIVEAVCGTVLVDAHRLERRAAILKGGEGGVGGRRNAARMLWRRLRGASRNQEHEREIPEKATYDGVLHRGRQSG